MKRIATEGTKRNPIKVITKEKYDTQQQDK